MKTVKQEVDYAYEAYDGTMFPFKNCGGEEKAKEECKKYESSAEGIVAERLKDVLIRHPSKPIESNAVRSDGEILKAPDTFYFDEYILSFFGFYNDCATCYIFAPKSQEDIDNFKQFAYLCGGKYIKNPERIKPGKLYFVAICFEIETTLINTFEECMSAFEEALRDQLVRAKAFLNPDKYIYTKSEEGSFVFKERQEE